MAHHEEWCLSCQPLFKSWYRVIYCLAALPDWGTWYRCLWRKSSSCCSLAYICMYVYTYIYIYIHTTDNSNNNDDSSLEDPPPLPVAARRSLQSCGRNCSAFVSSAPEECVFSQTGMGNVSPWGEWASSKLGDSETLAHCKQRWNTGNAKDAINSMNIYTYIYIYIYI